MVTLMAVPEAAGFLVKIPWWENTEVKRTARYDRSTRSPPGEVYMGATPG